MRKIRMNNSITIDSNFIKTLLSFPWFLNCGKATEIDNVMLSKDVRKSIQSSKWENILLEKRGEYTAQLSKNFKDGYRNWNQIIKTVKSDILPQLEIIWQKNLKAAGIYEPYILDDIKFNISTILMLHAYSRYIPMPDFFEKLLSIHASGHIPCGWRKGKESGYIQVF